jgi:ER-bound oxygenase mpaB/B'/Rubber oxygenase, catalytic domain
VTSTRWTDEVLDGLRDRGDEELDPMLDELRSADRALVRALYDDLVTLQVDLRTDRYPVPLRDWLLDRPPLPTWADHAQLSRAARFADRWLPELAVAYLVSSLPTAYAGANGAKVLTRASLLQAPDPLVRRVLQTLVVAMSVNELHGLDVGRPGYDVVRRVRTFHAVVRMMVEDLRFDRQTDPSPGAPWPSSSLGRVINQEDLLGTLWTFALTPLETLERTGVKIDVEDKEATVHLWCVVGHLLGISADVLPIGLVSATECWSRIKERQFRSSLDGQLLTRVLIDRCRDLIPIPFLRQLPAAAMRRNLGRSLADALAVPSARPGRVVLATVVNPLFYLSTRIPGASFVRAPVRNGVKRFVVRWLDEERRTPTVARVPHAQRQRLEPRRITDVARRARR